MLFAGSCKHSPSSNRHRVSGSTEIDISEYVLERVPITSNPGLKEWLNILAFDGTPIRIPLICSSELSDDGHKYLWYSGLNEKSLKISWLDKGKILWISWTTYGGEGSACMTVDGHAILQIANGQVYELFRDHFISHFRGGWYCSSSSTLRITFDAKKGEILFTRSYRRWEADEKKPLLLGGRAKVSVSWEKECYTRDITVSKIRRYKVLEGILKYQDGYSHINLGSDKYDIHDVVKFFNGENNRYFFGVKTSISWLRSNNEYLQTTDECTGEIILERHLKAYNVQSYEEARDLS